MATHIPDLLSFDSWENDTSISASGASSSASSSAEAGRGRTTKQDKGVAMVVVSIAGVLFSLDAVTFDKIRSLPWQAAATTDHPTDDDDDHVQYSLSTSPELFDVLVHHVLFGSLPTVASLRRWSEADQEELEIMALSLSLTELAEHMVVPRGDGGGHRRRGLLRSRSSELGSSWRNKAATAWSSRRRLLPASGKTDKQSTTTSTMGLAQHFHMA
jgi:hypothetical protein